MSNTEKCPFGCYQKLLCWGALCTNQIIACVSDKNLLNGKNLNVSKISRAIYGENEKEY